MKRKVLRYIAIFCLLALLLTGCSGTGNAGTTEIPTPVSTDPPTDPPTEPPKPDIVLDHSAISLTRWGQTYLLYTGEVDRASVTWQSSNEEIVKVHNGLVTAVGQGTAVVTAIYKDTEAVCEVNCMLSNQAQGTREPLWQPPETEMVSADFFDDAVFIGDSISLKLSYYAASTGLLGKAKFLVRGSYGAANAVYGYLLMPWQGQEMAIEDAVAATGAKKVFIMMGMNDIALYGVSNTINNWNTLITRILEKTPDAKIYIQSMTPIWTGGEIGDLNNAHADMFNEALAEFAAENGHTYIDVASYMKDGTNGLASRYTSDNYVHLTDAGADAWIKVLKAYPAY